MRRRLEWLALTGLPVAIGFATGALGVLWVVDPEIRGAIRGLRRGVLA